MNLTMSAGRMFPPIVREAKKQVFNQFSIARCVDELRTPGTIVSIHPEGTRNKSDDPYTFLPAKPGAGHIALGCPEAKVIPVYILGMGNDLRREFRWNVLSPGEHPIYVYFGAPLNFDDLRQKAREKGPRITLSKRAADRCMEGIKALAEEHRRTTSS
jgi:1-acyl-sn-glycerol-3-phosphate acyltransferase